MGRITPIALLYKYDAWLRIAVTTLKRMPFSPMVQSIRTCKPVTSASNMLSVVPLSIRLSLRKELAFPSVAVMVSFVNSSLVEYSTTNDVTCCSYDGCGKGHCRNKACCPFNAVFMVERVCSSYMDLTALGIAMAASGFKPGRRKQAEPGSVHLSTHDPLQPPRCGNPCTINSWEEFEGQHVQSNHRPVLHRSCLWQVSARRQGGFSRWHHAITGTPTLQ